MKGIKEVYTSEKIVHEYSFRDRIDMSIENRKSILAFDTVGSNLIQCLSCPYIDSTKTISNDIMEIKDVLGIEAARTAILN